MHELTIAKNIVEIVEEEVEKIGNVIKVKEIYFKAGALNAVIPESLIFSFDIVKSESKILREAVLKFEEIPIKIKCNNCDYEGILKVPEFFCPECGSTKLDVLYGKEMYVERIIVEEEKDGDKNSQESFGSK
ncbi:MAG: hydrogenase maturation nickel metallochaperone HypA [Candidatus Marinimicrobia bacterium]|nr:hydrogenase maturation nickel metallochaperone HypA [Candidatus Neomarinimicrobiota bacterium]